MDWGSVILVGALGAVVYAGIRIYASDPRLQT